MAVARNAHSFGTMLSEEPSKLEFIEGEDKIFKSMKESKLKSKAEELKRKEQLQKEIEEEENRL